MCIRDRAGPARGLPNDWKTALLEAPLRAAFAQVRVENDGIGALEAERRWGALQQGGVPMAHCAYVTWSTGIGTGVCVDGHVLRGKNVPDERKREVAHHYELFGGVSPAGQEALYEQLGQLRVQLARPGPTHPNPAPKEKS